MKALPREVLSLHLLDLIENKFNPITSDDLRENGISRQYIPMKWLLALCEGISVSATTMGRPLLEFKTLNYLAGVHKPDKNRFTMV